MNRSDLDFLNDILENLQDIEQFIEGLNLDDFLVDKKSSNAVLRSFEVMGEAAGCISKKTQLAYPEIPWRIMKDFRNKLIHDYFGIDKRIVWATIEERLPDLKQRITEAIAQEQRIQ